MVDVSCQCGSRFRLNDEWAGKSARCPVCQVVLQVPAVDAPRPAPVTGAAGIPTQSAGVAWAVPTRPAALSDTVPLAAASKTVVSKVTSIDEPPRPTTVSASGSLPPPAPSVPPAPLAAIPRAQEKWWGNPVLLRRLTIGISLAAGFLLIAGGLYAFFASPRGQRTVAVTEQSPATAHVSPDTSNEDAPNQVSAANASVDVRAPASAAVPEEGDPPVESANNAAPGDASTNATGPEPAATSISAQNVQAAKQPPPASGLSGVSRQYDDFHCQRIQQQFGWRVTPAAEIIEVDGVRLAISNLSDVRKARAPYLFLPPGEHAIRLRVGEQVLRAEIAEPLADTYRDMRKFFGVDEKIRTDELQSRGARAMDVHGAPFLLNLMGASYVAADQLDAAERKFRRALRVNPFFAPAHLNLAVCFLRRGDLASGERELKLAEACDVGNVFGLLPSIIRLRREHDVPAHDGAPVPLHLDGYLSAEQLTVEDERLSALMTALSKYAVQEKERGKILNNLAVHFAASGKTETALEYYREALEVFKISGTERFAFAEKVLSHMERACRESGFPEADEYAFMRESVLP